MIKTSVHRLKKDKVVIDFFVRGDTVEVYAENYARREYNEASCVAGDVALYDEAKSFSLAAARDLYRSLVADGYAAF